MVNVTPNFSERQKNQHKIEKRQKQPMYPEQEDGKIELDTIPARKRKALLILAPEELTRLEYEPQGNELLLNEQIHILSLNDELAGSLVDRLESSGLLEPGSLLIQSPYDTSDYAVVDKASSTFALAKYFHFTTLCGLLGAREVLVEQIEVKTSKGKSLFKGTLDKLGTKAKLEGQRQTFEAMRNNIKIKSTFDGGKPDLEAAESHLCQYQLLSDISMKSLIDQRKGSNPIKSRELTLSLSEESRKNLKVISDLKIPTYMNLQAQLDQVKQEEYEFTLTIKVEF